MLPNVWSLEQGMREVFWTFLGIAYISGQTTAPSVSNENNTWRMNRDETASFYLRMKILCQKETGTTKPDFFPENTEPTHFHFAMSSN